MRQSARIVRASSQAPEIVIDLIPLLKYCMSKVIAYKNTDRVCCCQIKFDSKEKILVSIASVPEHSIKVIKLMAGIIPLGTIWEFSMKKAGGGDTYDRLISMFIDQDANRIDHPLDAIIAKLLPCRSCDEAVRVLRETEERAPCNVSKENECIPS